MAERRTSQQPSQRPRSQGAQSAQGARGATRQRQRVSVEQRPRTTQAAPSGGRYRDQGRLPDATASRRSSASGQNYQRGQQAAGSRRGGQPQGQGRPGSHHTQQKQRGAGSGRLVFLILIALVVVVGVGFGVMKVVGSRQVVVNVNGTTMKISGSTTYIQLINEGYGPAKNGDLLAVDYALLGVGGGKPFTVTCNGKQVENLNSHVKNRTKILITPGRDSFETYQADEEVIPFQLEIIGDSSEGDLGVVMTEGSNGVLENRTGNVTKRGFSEVTTKPENKVIFYYLPFDLADVPSLPVCLIFNGGPSAEGTQKILDVLEKYDVKATFFMQGTQVEANKAAAKAVVSAGMDVGSNSYSFGNNVGSWGDLRQASEEGAYAEATQGFAAIKTATGTDTGVFCAPYGNFGIRMWQVLHDVVEIDVHWNIDSQDNMLDSAQAIADNIYEHAAAGGVILCHDAIDNTDLLAEALDIVIPKLQADGFHFKTITEFVNETKPTVAQARASDNTVHLVDTILVKKD